MDSVPPVDKLRREFDRISAHLETNRHDPRALDALMHEYRLLAEMAISEAERLQGTIYAYYSKTNNDRT